MIVGQVGKSRTFRISSRIITLTVIFLAAYILASILVFNGYFKELRANRMQSALLEELQEEIKETKRSLQRSKQHLFLLEEAIYDIGTQQKAPTRVLSRRQRRPPEPAAVAERQPVEAVEQATGVPRVGIENLNFEREGEKFTVTFKLMNQDDEDSPVSGYVHMIAVDKASTPAEQWPYPEVALKEGRPENYKKGQLFFIRRFRSIKGEYLLDEDTETPSSLRILVYDHPGNLIFENEFEVRDVL
jgi:hypothetical protein